LFFFTIAEEIRGVNGKFEFEGTPAIAGESALRGLELRIESCPSGAKERDTVPEKYRTYLIFGAPGSGKGTQGRTLGTIPRFFHCACGDVFRSIDTCTPLGKAFLEYSSKGQLVPDEITVELWRVSIQLCVESHQFKPDHDFLVLDGIPRNLAQADLMAPFIEVRKVFHLSCPDREKIVTRLKKRAVKDNRLDDANEEVIRQRLETYQQESRPLLEHYGKGLIVNIDATEPPIVVLNTIVSEIVDGRKPEFLAEESELVKVN
jgi:adenylate kinase